MKIDTMIGPDLKKSADSARRAEADGYDGAFTAETSNDPFFPLALAAPATKELTLGTSIAVAFARNPMLLANIGYDLNALSDGRFVLGLGSQIKPHITKRFSMEWSKPAARMREMIQAIRAIWDGWETGERVQFRGEFYTHTLMTPFFDPGPNPAGTPRIFIAAVGPLMTQVAGEVCDGLFAHPFTTSEYLKDVTLPALQAGRDQAGRTAENFEVALPVFIVTGKDQAEVDKAAAAVRAQLAFYGSTPAYRGVLEHHGWGELQPELNAMSKQGQWAEMANMINDDILNTFAVVAEPDKVAASVMGRFGETVQRLSFNTMGATEPALLTSIIQDLRS